MNERRFLTETELRTIVPAAFASSPNEIVSNRFIFVPTYKIIEHFRKLGWHPVAAHMNKVKDREHGKHSIRFARKAGALKVGDIIEEIVVVNAHDGTCFLHIDMGIFRCICGNQAIVQDTSFASIAQKHMKIEFVDIERAVNEAAKQFKILAQKVNEYKTIEMTEVQKNKFAALTRNIVWGEESKIDPKLLLNTRRDEDKENNLWTIYNVLQENVIKGGVKYEAPVNESGKIRKRSTRAVKNLERDLKINKELWTLMAAFAVNKRF